MILLLASIADQNTAAFAREFAGLATVLTCYDLARWPSRFFHRRFTDSTISAGGKTIGVASISGVLNLLPAIFPEELSFYAEEERAYQTAELHALIVYFLSSLACPVVNRPSTVSLTGPVQNPASWLAVASAAAIPVARVTIASTGKPLFPAHDPVLQVVCVNGKLITPSATAADRYTVDLARHCRLPYLQAQYRWEGSEIRFVTASSYPDIRCQRTRTALREYLLGEIV